VLNVDAWDGYPAAQARLYDALARTPNPVVLTGDVHAAFALDVTPEPGDRPIGVELATTSISSGGDGADLAPTGQTFLAANPHLHYANQRRGYLRGRLTPDQLTVDFRTVPYVAADAAAPIATDRSFVVVAGEPGFCHHRSREPTG
jgi:alkaline phosphatase D